MRRPVWSGVLWVVGTLGAALLGAACGREPAARAAPSNPDAPARPRIVALAPAIARTLADAGAAEFLVGRHAFDPWTDQSLPVCGDQAGLDYEALLRVRPTHVLLQWGERELPQRLERLAARHGWTVRSFPLLTLDEVMEAGGEIEREGRRLKADGSIGNRRAESSSLPSLPSLKNDSSPRERMGAVLARRGAIDPERVGRVLLLHSSARGGAGVLGPGSYHHQMLTSLGARSAIQEGAAGTLGTAGAWGAGSPYMTLDREDLLHLAPDAIIIIQPRWNGREASDVRREEGGEPQELMARLGRAATLPLPALRGQVPRLALIDDPMALVPGTNLIDVAREMAAILEEWSGRGP